MRLGGEKPHQGLPSENPAPNQVREVCKFTVLLGMRGQAELNRAGSCCTGKERDTESGNDYFGARYYASSMGRFMSPDWAAKIMPVPYAVLADPQSLNLYAYVRNNPMTRFDADGHCDGFWGCAKSWLNVVEVKVTAGFTAGVSGQWGLAKGKLEFSPLAAEGKSGLGGKDAEAKVKSGASASGEIGPLKAKVGAGGQISTSGGASLNADASASAGPGELKASASLDPSGAHTELSSSADPSKSIDTDSKVGLGFKAGVGLEISINLTELGNNINEAWNGFLQQQYSSAEPIVGPSTQAGGLSFPDYAAPQ
jgi:RHS repeat-associated protein